MPNTAHDMSMTSVVVAVIQNDRGQYFVCQRQAHQPFAGYWEFPGGKQEVGESLEQAMTRELQEELGITPSDTRPFLSIPFDNLRLHIWHITAWQGEIHGAEGQSCGWRSVSEITKMTFPPANDVLIEALLTSNHLPLLT